MGRIVLFRRFPLVAAIFGVLFGLHGSADALWIDVTSTSQPAQAPLVVELNDKSPPQRDQRHGLFALPPPVPDPIGTGTPRLKLQYRADFPISITIETDGAVAGSMAAPSGAMNVSSRVVFSKTWWSPQLVGSVADFNAERLFNGRVEFGEGRLRSEWKVRF